MSTTIPTTTTLAALPALGADLHGGTFAGITTSKDGTHSAVILLPGNGTKLTWDKARAWAEEQGGQLPTRAVDALMFANVRSALPSRGWHWTSEEHEDDASVAWDCRFITVFQSNDLKSYECGAVAVRLIPLNP